MANHIFFSHIAEFANLALESLIEAVDVDVKVETKDVWNILCVSALTEIPWNLLSVICEIPRMEEYLAKYIKQEPDNVENILGILEEAKQGSLRFEAAKKVAQDIYIDICNFSATLRLVVTCYMYTDKYLAIKEYCDPDNSIVVSKLLREMFENAPAVLRNSNIIDAKKAEYWGML